MLIWQPWHQHIVFWIGSLSRQVRSREHWLFGPFLVVRIVWTAEEQKVYRTLLYNKTLYWSRSPDTTLKKNKKCCYDFNTMDLSDHYLVKVFCLKASRAILSPLVRSDLQQGTQQADFPSLGRALSPVFLLTGVRRRGLAEWEIYRCHVSGLGAAFAKKRLYPFSFWFCLGAAPQLAAFLETISLLPWMTFCRIFSWIVRYCWKWFCVGKYQNSRLGRVEPRLLSGTIMQSPAIWCICNPIHRIHIFIHFYIPIHMIFRWTSIS